MKLKGQSTTKSILHVLPLPLLFILIGDSSCLLSSIKEPDGPDMDSRSPAAEPSCGPESGCFCGVTRKESSSQVNLLTTRSVRLAPCLEE